MSNAWRGLQTTGEGNASQEGEGRTSPAPSQMRRSAECEVLTFMLLMASTDGNYKVSCFLHLVGFSLALHSTARVQVRRKPGQRDLHSPVRLPVVPLSGSKLCFHADSDSFPRKAPTTAVGFREPECGSHHREPMESIGEEMKRMGSLTQRGPYTIFPVRSLAHDHSFIHSFNEQLT